MTQTVKARSYPVSYLRKCLDMSIMPISGLSIPKITMPNKNIQYSIITEIRKLFNIVTATNVDIVKTELKKIIIDSLVNKDSKELLSNKMNDIVNEILNNFIISDTKLLQTYTKMLNAISCVAIRSINTETGDPEQSEPIRSYFLKNCRTLIYKYICSENIKLMCMKNLDDIDEEDLFNKEKNKITNLIMTICSLYNQRNLDVDIKLTAIPVHGIIQHMLNECIIIISKMKELGNPYESDGCLDEEAYIILNRMYTLYSELMLVFFDTEYASFATDTTQIKDKTTGSNQTLSNIIFRFKQEIIPNLEEPYLLARCNKIGF